MTGIGTPVPDVHVLDNGLRVILLPDRRLPVAAVCVWYKVGAHDEPAGRTGLAHLLEHMMFQGSENVPANDHTAYIQDIGGATNGGTSHEGSYFVDDIPSNYLRPVLWLEADRMRSVGTALCADRLETQRQVAINERLQRYENSPLNLVRERVLRLAAPEGHPFAHMPAGNMADLRMITLEDARLFWRQYYCPSNAILSIVGDIDATTTMSYVHQYFGSIPAGKTPGRPVTSLAEFIPDASSEHASIEYPFSGAMSAYRLPRSGDPAGLAAVLGVAILARPRYGRLWRSLLPGSVASAVRFDLLSMASSPSVAIFEIITAHESTSQQADRAMTRELSRFADDGPTAAELATEKALRGRGAIERATTVAGRAAELAEGAALHDDPAHFYTAAARLGEVSARDVRDAAARYLHDANRVTLTYAPDSLVRAAERGPAHE